MKRLILIAIVAGCFSVAALPTTTASPIVTLRATFTPRPDVTPAPTYAPLPTEAAYPAPDAPRHERHEIAPTPSGLRCARC